MAFIRIVAEARNAKARLAIVVALLVVLVELEVRVVEELISHQAR